MTYSPPHLWWKYGTDLQFYFLTVIFSWGKSLPAQSWSFYIWSNPRKKKKKRATWGEGEDLGQAENTCGQTQKQSRDLGRAGLTEYSREVRLMKRRKSSPPDDTATEESTPHKVSMALVRFALRPWIVSPRMITWATWCSFQYHSPLMGLWFIHSFIHSFSHWTGCGL